MCKCSRHIDLVRTYTDTNPAEDNAKGAGKMFSEDTVAVLLMALGSVSISSDQYKMMSALDGTKTASSFQHSCRSVLKKAKELKVVSITERCSCPSQLVHLVAHTSAVRVAPFSVALGITNESTGSCR